MERTLVIIKPDAMQRGLMGVILARLEQRGLKVVGMKLIRMDQALARRHYASHQGKPFFEGLVRHITSCPVVVVVLEGTEAVAAVRQTMGATSPLNATPGTIRADYGLEIGRNLVHGSDSEENAQQEINLFFQPEELFPWSRDTDKWIMER